MREVAQRISVIEDERVVPRGSATTYWFVRVHDGWVRAGNLPEARVETVEPGPSVIWQQRVDLELPRGTLLMQVRSAPHVVAKSPLDYLSAGTRRKRRTVRTVHRVTARGLVTENTPRKT